MRILLTQVKLEERKRREKLKRHAKLARAITKKESAWFVDLMTLPLDQRIGKVSAQIGKDFSFSHATGEVGMTLAKIASGGYSVTISLNSGKIVREVNFGSAARAATYFLTLLPTG